MIVAATAYRDLSPDDRAKALAILSHHPSYEKWKAEVPAGQTTIEEGLIAFMGASKWPDDIRVGSSPWKHESWHYVDFPVTPPDFVFKGSPAPKKDIIWAINRCVLKLKDTSVSPEDKACWLSWLMHLVGDITQPLHCCALVNDVFHAPKGDKGGNEIYVSDSPNNDGMTLHQKVDNMLGDAHGFHFNLLRSYVNDAIRLGSEYKREAMPELLLHPTVEQWARESWEVAVKDIYLRGALPYGLTKEKPGVLPEGYTKKLKSMATERVTLGGYRLADLIRECLR